MLDELQERFEFLSHTANTPARFVDGAVRPDGDIKRMMLDRGNYYATTGGHGACRGCGEVTALRLVMSANHAIHGKRRKEHIADLEQLIELLNAKRASVQDDAGPSRAASTHAGDAREAAVPARKRPDRQRPGLGRDRERDRLQQRLCVDVPVQSVQDPWVNSLFQDTPAVAKGLFEGLTASATDDIKALRVARLELEDAYLPEVHDRYFRMFGWDQFTPQELALLPTAFSVGGDGATYDIGFGALSRLLTTSTPIKVMVLNTGVYSNTGGQASTASLTGQDSDLTRFGAAHAGKQEDRKELGPDRRVPSERVRRADLDGAAGAFPRQRHGVPQLHGVPGRARRVHAVPGGTRHCDAAASRRSRLAVESRMNPVFVHDPRRGGTLHARFSLDGNPASTGTGCRRRSRTSRTARRSCSRCR